MGGMCTIAVRSSDKKLKSFKVYTGFMDKHFNDVKMLDENYLMNFLEENKYGQPATQQEHEDYDDTKALFAPYDYGILLFDFVSKQVFSMNNFSGFLNTGISPLKSDYKDFIENQRSTKYILRASGKETKEDAREIKTDFFRHIYMVHQVLKAGGFIMKDEKAINEKGESLESVLIKMYGEDLEPPKPRQPKEHTFDVEAYQDLQGQLPGWTIHVGDGSNLAVNKAYQYVKEQNFPITQLEHDLWNEYIVEAYDE